MALFIYSRFQLLATEHQSGALSAAGKQCHDDGRGNWRYRWGFESRQCGRPDRNFLTKSSNRETNGRISRFCRPQSVSPYMTMTSASAVFPCPRTANKARNASTRRFSFSTTEPWPLASLNQILFPLGPVAHDESMPLPSGLLWDRSIDSTDAQANNHNALFYNDRYPTSH